jgi:hypothetical protein
MAKTKNKHKKYMKKGCLIFLVSVAVILNSELSSIFEPAASLSGRGLILY